MADVHTTIRGPKNEATVVFDNPGVTPLPAGAGQTVTQTKDTSGKVLTTSGQVPNSTVVINNPG